MRQLLLALLFSFSLAASFALPLTVPAAHAADYILDPAHTQVRFSWHHFGFSVPEANFNEVTGTLKVDDEDPSTAELSVTIPVKSIDTHVPVLNEHLLTKPEYFKVEEHPDITFESKEIRNVSEDGKRFEVVGTLTVNGIAKEVVLDAKLNKKGPHPMFDGAPAAGFNATTTLKRSVFGLDAYVPNVSDEMEVRITAEAIEADAYAKKMEERKAQQE
ncbi:YceI family protein [Methyloligella solikamskensis]|uniref:YceI family protein n=1 Tax=Methyloligella solikamskensis TaxID=1177756 RepID=A0ABW3JAI7_9HYPH